MRMNFFTFFVECFLGKNLKRLGLVESVREGD